MILVWTRRLAACAAALFLAGTAAAAQPQRGAGCELTLRVTCRSDGGTPEDGSLTFVLWDARMNILQRAVNLRGNASFAPLEFSAQGQYAYYITQEGGEDPGMAYDPAAYQVIVSVTEEAGTLTARVTQLNRVCADPLGEPEALEQLDCGAPPAFENTTWTLSTALTQTHSREDASQVRFWLIPGAFCLAGAIWLPIRRRRTRAAEPEQKD